MKEILVSYRLHALGLDELPKFTWKLASERQNVRQATYHIVVAETKNSGAPASADDGRSKEGAAAVWDSGTVASEQSAHVLYSGPALKACTAYEVQIEAVDNYGDRHVGTTSFETGLLCGGNQFTAEWVTYPATNRFQTVCPVFTKDVSWPQASVGGAIAAGRTIAKARIYASAMGVYEIALNGEKVGDVFLAPGWTSYNNQIQYQTYDVTEMVRKLQPAVDRVDASKTEKKLTLSMTVGNGWFAGYLNGEGQNHFYGDRTAALMEMHICFMDGTEAVIGTDGTWKVTEGVIRSAELYMGETQDFRQPKANAIETAEPCEVIHDFTAFRQTGQLDLVDPGKWETSDQAGTEQAETAQMPHLIAQISEPIRITDRIAVQEVIHTPAGETVLDFGQNMAGLVEVTLPHFAAEADDTGAALGETRNPNGSHTDGSHTITLYHGEALDRFGNFYNENYRTAKSEDVYVYTEKELGKKVLPHFTYHGFRYVKVLGLEDLTDEEIRAAFTACAMHTDMRRTGFFHTNNDPVNQLYGNIIWGQRSNFFDIPTDCPQRDERLGWTGDAMIFSSVGSKNYDTALLFDKWLRDVASETDDAHGVPHIVPSVVGKAVGTAVWSDCATFIPWNLYQIYGDREMLRRQYPLMQQWVEYMRRESGGDLWTNGFQRGDWLALDAPASRPGLMSGGTDKNLVANICYAMSEKYTAEAAGVLGYAEDAKTNKAGYEHIRELLNEEYVTKTGRIVSETQTACAMLLHFDLIREENRDRVAEILKRELNATGNHLTTGFVGTAFLCDALTENGMHDLATETFLQEDYPGWMYAVKKGATTIWERWNSVLPDGSFDQSGMNSLNHYSYGAVADWMYQKIGGISALEPGYKRSRIQPYPTKGMSRTQTSLETVYGTLSCSMACENGQMEMQITIPPNTEAEVILPGKEEAECLLLGSGEYEFFYETKLCLTAGKYSMQTKYGELFDDPQAAEILYRHFSDLKESPLQGFLRGQTLQAMLAMAPDRKDAMEKLVIELNQLLG